MDVEKTPAPGGEPGAPAGNGAVDLSKVKRGRGRPRKPLPTSTSDSKKHPPTGEANTLFDASFLSESAVCLVEIADEVIARTLADRVAKVMPEKLAEFVKLQQTVGFNDKDRVMVDMSVTAIAQKYAILTKFGPELLLLAWGTQYGIRQARLFKFVNQMAKEREKLAKETTPAKPSPPAGPPPGGTIEEFPGPRPAAARN